MAVKFQKQTMSLTALKHADWEASQLRAGPIGTKVTQYAEEMEQGANFPPPVVFFDTKEQIYYVGDGFHRIYAAERNGQKKMLVDLRRGTKLDAMLYCLKINSREQRGLPFTNGDKKCAVMKLLDDPVAGTWSMQRIATEVGCSGALVQHVVKHERIERPETVLDVNDRPVSSRQSHPTPFESQERRRKIKDMKLRGASIAEIAHETGLDPEQIKPQVRRALTEPDVIDCPRCNGTGKISNIPRGIPENN